MVIIGFSPFRRSAVPPPRSPPRYPCRRGHRGVGSVKTSARAGVGFDGTLIAVALPPDGAGRQWRGLYAPVFTHHYSGRFIAKYAHAREFPQHDEGSFLVTTAGDLLLTTRRRAVRFAGGCGGPLREQPVRGAVRNRRIRRGASWPWLPSRHDLHPHHAGSRAACSVRTAVRRLCRVVVALRRDRGHAVIPLAPRPM